MLTPGDVTGGESDSTELRRGGSQGEPPRIDCADQDQTPRTNERKSLGKKVPNSYSQRNHNKPVAESEIDAIRSAGPNPCEAINCCEVVRAVPCRMPNAKPTSAAAFIIFSVEASPIHQLAAVSSTFGKRVSKRSVLSISPAGISPGLP